MQCPGSDPTQPMAAANITTMLQQCDCGHSYLHDGDVMIGEQPYVVLQPFLLPYPALLLLETLPPVLTNIPQLVSQVL